MNFFPEPFHDKPPSGFPRFGGMRQPARTGVRVASLAALLVIALLCVVDKGAAEAARLTWTDMSSGSGQETYFAIERKQMPNGTYSEIGRTAPDAEQFTDMQVTPGVTYAWRVRAGNTTGQSAPSNEVTLLVPAVVLGLSQISCRPSTTPPVIAGLALAFGFNEGSGATVGDTSGNNNTGTISGATWTTQGKYGGALTFDGINDVVTVPDAASLDVTSALTLEAWVYPMVVTVGWKALLQKQVDAYLLTAGSSGGPPAVGGTLNGVCCTNVYAPTALAVNSWTHVAGTYDGAIMRLYLNGVQVASRAATGSLQVNANPLSMGGNTYGGEYFQGRIDEVRIYNRALTPAEIATDMNTP